MNIPPQQPADWYIFENCFVFVDYCSKYVNTLPISECALKMVHLLKIRSLPSTKLATNTVCEFQTHDTYKDICLDSI